MDPDKTMTDRKKSKSSTTFKLETLCGEKVEAFLDQLAQLRIEVFREYPYLYDGDYDYEKAYLKGYAAEPECLVVVMKDRGRLVGATTGMPMMAADKVFQEPFVASGIALDQVFYFGESVILPDHRGCGAGHAFFDMREQHARQLGYRYTTFCAVRRSEVHPLRPDDYRSLDGFWTGRGYRKRDDLQSHLAWREVGDEAESLNTLTFWLRDWAEKSTSKPSKR